ncbi:MAG: hypothetical protein ABIV13_03475 [Fimbriimonadales bacterium]
MARRLGIALVFALTALLPTWQFLFGGKVPAPVDWAHHSAPWNGPEPESAYDILAMDGALQFLPWRHYMLESYRAGHVPLWNPNTLGGAPFLANSQSAPMYPLHWLWPFGPEALLSFSAWLHLVIAGLGVYALCRRLGGLVVGGFVAGISVQLSAFFIAWTALPSVVMTAAWIPWCLWAVLWVASAVSGRALAAVGGCVGMMLLAGHLQIAAYGLLAVVAFVLWLVAFPVSDGSDGRARWRAVWAFAGIALGFAIAAPQLLPAIENGRQGHRAGTATAEGWDAYRGSAAAPLELVTLVSPDFFGTPQPRNENTGATSYWLAYEKPGRHYAEIAFYVGPVVLPLAAFALVGIRRRPHVGFFGVLALLGLFIALGTPVAQALYFGVPGWSATGSPARAAVLVTLGLCVLAGMGLRDDVKLFGENKEPKKWLIYSPLLLPGLIYLSVAIRQRPDHVIEVFGSPSSGTAGLITWVAFVALVWTIAKIRWTLYTLIVLAIVPIAFLHSVIPMSGSGDYDVDFPGKKKLQEAGRIAVVGDDWPFLTAPTKSIAPPNTLVPYGIKTVSGYDSIVSEKYKAKLDDANGEDSAPPANGNMMFVKPQVDLIKLRRMGADAVMASTEFTYDLPIIYEGDNWRLYKLEGETDQPFLFHESYNHKKLRWEGDFRDISRNWLDSADADGWEMIATSYSFTEKTVVATYRPHSYRLGLLLAMMGGSALLALAIGGRRARATTDGTVV